MKIFVRYLLFTTAFVLISSGVVVSATLNSTSYSGSRELWLVVPVTALLLAAAAVNDSLLVPRLLLRHKYAMYVMAVFLTAYAGAYSAIWIEFLMCTDMGLPHRIHNYASGWILIDTFCNVLLVMFILLGLGARALYGKLKTEVCEEKKYADSLRQYINLIRRRFSSERILSGITHVAETLRVNAYAAVDEIQSLSSYLRSRLYELPEPPRPSLPGRVDSDSVDSRAVRWLADPRYRCARHAAFLLAVPLLSFTVFFNAPDQPVFTSDRCLSFLSMILMLDAIAYVDILWLSRRFARHHNLKRYIAEVVTLVAIVMVPVVVAQIATYDINVIDKGLPPVMVILSLLSSLVTLILFVGGVSALMLLQNWISGRRRMTMLHAETARREYMYLRKQINPHFLFNVLNNAGILIEEDHHEAERLLIGLHRLLAFLFFQTERHYTTVGQEMLFLRTYLNLEASRRDHFNFSVSADESLNSVRIPTLMFIPFVENAVKYSSAINRRCMVAISVSRHGDRLLFRCENTFKAGDRKNAYSGGLGLANTRRRLDFLYNSRYSLRQKRTPELFITTLIIPYDNEMHYN